MPNKDYYSILGVSKNASSEEIKQAFRRLAHQHHPDKGGDQEKFKEINEAYQILSNSEKRSRYDRFGSDFANQANPAGGGFGFDFSGQGFDFDLNDVFDGFGDMFGFSANRRGSKRRRGEDIEALLTIDFKEAAFGTEKEISLNKLDVCEICGGSGAKPGSKIENCSVCGGSGQVFQNQRTIFGTVQVQGVCHNCQGSGKHYTEKCSSCHGQGARQRPSSFKVKIPAGIDNGGVLRLAGRGAAGMNGAPAGDLYLKIKVKPDPDFNREGFDLKTKVEVGFSLAALGGKVAIKGLEGMINLKIPEGTQSGTIFRLKEKGISKLGGRGRGDQFIEVIVKIPTHLTRQQRKTIEELGL